jgi:hypothetical protein
MMTVIFLFIILLYLIFAYQTTKNLSKLKVNTNDVNKYKFTLKFPFSMSFEIERSNKLENNNT